VSPAEASSDIGNHGLDAGLKCLRENRVVPTGLRVFFPTYPALKRWATLFCAYGAASCSARQQDVNEVGRAMPPAEAGARHK